MRRLLVSVVFSLLLVAFVPGVASATHSNGQGPDKDLIAGAAKGPLPTPFGTFAAHFHANAQSFASGGTPAQGTWFTDLFDTPIGDVSISGVVVCINAIGNAANWRGVITESSTALAPPGYGVLSRHVDNGEGQNDPEDQATGFLTGPPGPNPTCPATTQLPTQPITSGNLLVHDGI
jgi:hypothetical protein